MDTAEIVVVGSCNMDHTSYSPRIPSSGETVHGTKYVTGNGGKGANQCVAAAKLGARTMMVGKVGCDADGESFVQALQSLNINTKYLLKTASSSTGIAAITVDDHGNNSIVIIPGANLLLEPSDLRPIKEDLEKAKVVLCQNEISLKTTLDALRLAKSCNIPTIFNPAPAPENDVDPEFFALSDILCCNEHEASFLTGVAVTDEQSAMKAVTVLVEKGCNVGLVTLGANGCVFQEKNSSLPPKIVPVPERVHAIDTTGAGDSFVGSLAFFMVRFPFLPFKEKVSRACFAAGLSVCKKGTQVSFPKAADIPKRIFSSESVFV